MKAFFAVLLWVGALPLFAQSPQSFDVAGVLRLTDTLPEPTPVEALSFQILPLAGGFAIPAQPDREGRFLLRNVRPGRYSLTFPMPGRLAVFAIGSRDLAPGDFELSSSDTGTLSIVVSEKSTTVAIRVRGLQAGQNNAIALLVPADDRLTLRESCSSNRLTGPDTTFQFVPIGKYRLLVFNSKYLQDVSAYAPRVATFLSNESVTVEASPGHAVTGEASYIADDTIETAIRMAGGPFIHPQIKAAQ
jgi:hypothetical protein